MNTSNQMSPVGRRSHFVSSALRQCEQWLDHAVSSSAVFSIINSQLGTQGSTGEGDHFSGQALKGRGQGHPR